VRRKKYAPCFLRFFFQKNGHGAKTRQNAEQKQVKKGSKKGKRGHKKRKKSGWV
jgi:hypothetical protein